MANGWLDHKQLMIIKGIGKTPGDNNSAENDPVIVNLLSNLVSLMPDGWSPSIPAVKNGGVWADSPVSDGRQLIAAAAGNVTEKMTLIISDNSYLGMIKAYLGLNKMAQDCRDYWETQVQIDPVYLVWAAGCNTPPLPQYALIYNIELSPEYVDGSQPTIRVSVTIEREPYWRGIPPGANPKMWSYYVNASHPQFNSNVATLVTTSDHLITQTISNCAEWTPAAYGLQSTFLSKNYVDISASQIPGDAPALVEMNITTDSNPPANIYISRHSKPQSGIGHDNVNRVNSLILNGGDGSVGSGTKTPATATTGVRSNGSSVTYYEVLRTSTGIDGAFADFVTWGTSTGTGLIKLDRNLFRGTFAIFCRCRNGSAAAPVTTDMRIRLIIEQFENNATQYLTSFTLQDVNPAAGTIYQLSYMGTITIPFETRSVQSLLGYGLQLEESSTNLRVRLQQKVDVATANRTFEMIDLIFMPLDEELAQIALQFNATSSSGVATIDNTGYLSHGDLQQFANGYISDVLSGGVGQQVRGQNINLIPRTNQRLYFISDGYPSSSTPSSEPNKQLTIRLNIVPRWSGIRDT